MKAPFTVEQAPETGHEMSRIITNYAKAGSGGRGGAPNEGGMRDGGRQTAARFVENINVVHGQGALRDFRERGLEFALSSPLCGG
jgi:hypothetical protein